MRDFEVRRHFSKVLEKLDVIDAKVSTLPRVQVQLSGKLSPTLSALQMLHGSGTATEVSRITGQSRAAVSSCLNELVRLNMASKATRTGVKGGPVRIFTLKEAETVEGKTVGC